MTLYIQQKSDSAVFYTCAVQTVDNADHLKSCQDFVTSRGMSLDDFVIADGTDEQIDTWIKAQDKAAMTYADKRKRSYPPIGDQLDAMWKGGDDAAAMKVIVDKVKSDNPKG